VKITERYNANNHVMGGTIMGRDPTDSVVDADCRTMTTRICTSRGRHDAKCQLHQLHAVDGGSVA
jgi:hypothetical protein